MASFQTAIRAVTAADPDASLVPVILTEGMEGLILGLYSDTPGATLSLRIIWATSDGKFLAVGTPIKFTAALKPEWGVNFLATPDSGPVWEVLGDHALIKVDNLSVTTSKWWIVPGFLR